jgi:hypothetical protein
MSGVTVTLDPYILQTLDKRGIPLRGLIKRGPLAKVLQDYRFDLADVSARLQVLKRRGLIVYDKDFRTWRKA